MSQEMLGKMVKAVVEGEPNHAEALAKEALEKGLDPLQCITEGQGYPEGWGTVRFRRIFFYLS